MKTLKTMKSLAPITAVLLLAGLVVGASTAQAGSGSSRAAVAFLQGSDVDVVAQQAAEPNRDIRVHVWHGREDDATYRRSEPLEVYFRTNADMYVVVYRLDTDGQVEVLWPTSRFDDGFVYGNHTYSLPRPGSPTRLRTSDIRGVEYVQAIASEYPFDLRRLGIDFRFDPDDRGEYRYAVSGDPFLAVNDINYAITGLEEDADYIVTDWAHVYVESQVDYPRYTCRQCHDQSQGYHPYVDTCTTVNVYNDWGWHRSWYNRFGWYPLYYEPPYYYWDVVYSRPYWYPYYPIAYTWPTFGVYVRPYPVYWWFDSPYTYVDFRVRFKKPGRYYRTLYDLDGPRVRRAIRDHHVGKDARGRSPVSVRGALRGADRDDRVDRDRLVRSRMPDRDHRGEVGRTVTTRRDRIGRDSSREVGRTGVRTDLARRDRSERLRSLEPDRRTTERITNRRSSVRAADRERTSGERGERRWTRPVVRNRDDAPARTNRIDRTERRRSSSADRTRNVERSRTPRRDSPEVQRSQPTRRSSSREQRAAPTRRSGSDRSRQSVKPQRSRSSDRSRQSVTPQRSRSSDRSRQSVKPQRSRSSDRSRQSVKPQRSRSSGGSQKVSPSRNSSRKSSSSGSSRSSGGSRGGSSRSKRGGRGG